MKRPLGGLWYRWENAVGCEDVDWICLAQLNERGNEPSGSIKGREFLN